MAAREQINMHPKNHRSQSARPRGRNSTPWGVVPVETLIGPKEEPSKSENDRSVGSKKRTRSSQGRCSTPPCRASKRIKNRPRKYSFQEVATGFRGCLDPKNRGKRSVRPRRTKPAPTSAWAMSLDGFQNLGTAASKFGNADRNVGSKTRGGTAKDVAKAIEEEKHDSALEQSTVAMVEAEVKESVGEDANGTDEQTGPAVVPETSLDVKDGSSHADADANSVVHAGVPETDALPDLSESNCNGSIADTLAKPAVQTNNDFDPLKDRAKDAAEFDSKTISGLDQDDVNVQFDLASAESALASLYGESVRDMCIEFAVRLLMNETPLPNEAAEIEEFFTQKFHGAKSAKRQRQEEPSNVCSAWGNLQSDKMLFASRC